MNFIKGRELYEYRPMHHPTLSAIFKSAFHPTREQIETRAYELYLKRGRVQGHDLEDWLQAERELSQMD